MSTGGSSRAEFFYVAESDKSFYEACCDLPPVVERLGFAVFGRCDLGETLARRGVELDEDCQLFDIGNHRLAERLLAEDMRLGLLVPWRIAVFTENGATRLALIRPGLLGAGPLAELEQSMRQIVDEAR